MLTVSANSWHCLSFGNTELLHRRVKLHAIETQAVPAFVRLVAQLPRSPFQSITMMDTVA